MSMLNSGELQRIHADEPDSQKAPIKCRIPQRLTPARQKLTSARNKNVASSDSGRAKQEIPTQHSRFGIKTTVRPRSTESRPRTAKVKDESQYKQYTSSPIPKSIKSLQERESYLPTIKDTSSRVFASLVDQAQRTMGVNKRGKYVINEPVRIGPIIVPRVQRTGAVGRSQYYNRNIRSPSDQDSLKQFEHDELQRNKSDMAKMISDLNETDSKSTSSKIDRFKNTWQEKLVAYERMKNELNDKQKALLELYSLMKKTQLKMASIGETMPLPPAEELCIMNVGQISPNQLLQLCAESAITKEDENNILGNLSIEVNKVFNMPNKLVAMCEETLAKRKEIIDWFDTIKKVDQGISMNKLSKKITELYAENNVLQSSLQNIKTEFNLELHEIMDCLRKGVNETMALQLRTEQLTYELAEVNNQNAELRKKAHTTETFKSANVKYRLEELEKELKEERSRKLLLKDRLARAEGQLRSSTEKFAQLEAALEQARSRTWSLERTVEQQNEQNKKLQLDFDVELNKLTESIQENTMHLEEIAKAREKLQNEKEDLEKQLLELSSHYDESRQGINNEMSLITSKLLESEQKLEEEKEEKKILEARLETVTNLLEESEGRHEKLMAQIHERDELLAKAANNQLELNCAKHDIEKLHKEAEEYKNQLSKQGETIREIEFNFNETINLEMKLKRDLSRKDEHVAELEKKQAGLMKQLQESEGKMESYEEQLSSLKEHISQMQEEFGEFQDISQLHEMINQQRAKLLEATRQNGELAEALQKKEIELEQQQENILEQEQLLEQRENDVKVLSEKEEEHANIIKLLRNNLELRAQADADWSQQLSEKNAEIDSLMNSVETRKLQISQLEKIILTLEDQLRKVNLQKRKDEEKMLLLEKTVAEYEAYHSQTKHNEEAPAGDLDNLIKILEDELGTTLDSQINMHGNKKFTECNRHDKPFRDEYREVKDNLLYRNDEVPTKMNMSNYTKKTQILKSNDQQHKGDHSNLKKKHTNMETQKWVGSPEQSINTYVSISDGVPLSYLNEETSPIQNSGNHQFSRNLQFLMNNHMREEKKCKMFRIATHKL